MTPTMLWRPTSSNTKTGNIPQGYVGKTRSETERSCEGCPLRRNGCYHWFGQPIAAQSSMQKRAAKREGEGLPDDYSLSYAVEHSYRNARYVRGAVGGDPWVFARETVEGWVDDIKKAGLRGLLLYTHFAADKARHLCGLALASVHSLVEADQRIREGWRAALVVPYKVPGSKRNSLRNVPEYNGEKFVAPGGERGIVCPEQLGKAVTCNSCGLCDPSLKKPNLIIFLQH